jgi:hypothetical protein
MLRAFFVCGSRLNRPRYGAGGVMVTLGVAVASGEMVAEAVGVGVSVPGGGGGVLISQMVGVASGGTVGGGGTVEVDSYSNVAVGSGGVTVEVEIVSRMSGAYSLYGPIGETVPVGSGGTVGGGGTVRASGAALPGGKAR